MKNFNRLRFITWISYLLLVVFFNSSGICGSLYDTFKDPPHKYTMRPFWFWSGPIDSAEVARQIREMSSQGVYGAFVHARGNLETRYLSEDWWNIIRNSLRVAKDEGYYFCVVDEFEWPGGEARDIWNPGLPSKVLQKFPQYRMHHLVPYEYAIKGPQPITLQISKQPVQINAFRLRPDSLIEISSLTSLNESWREGRLAWNVPEGNWIIQEFRLEPTQGIDGGLVDLLNPKAIKEFINLTHEEYYQRFKEYMGTVMDIFYSDHEGDEGRELAWTPDLFDTFQKEKGYDLKPLLSLLTTEAGEKSTEVRYDYLDVISNLYSRSFFQQESNWCKAHNMHITGHLWESPLSRVVEFSGDHFRAFRAWDVPGIDALFDWGRSPRDFKEIASISHYKKTLFTCENQGLHGWESYFDLQKARLGTNGCGAWGVSMFIPHAFNYMKDQIIYPPDWFFHQPFWKYFRHYADYVRRISYMNATGTHVAPVLLYYPITSAFAAVGNISLPGGAPTKWKPEIKTLEDDYRRLQEGLSHSQWDYDVIDDTYLAEAEFKNGKIQLANETYSALVLPPMKYIRSAAAKRITEYLNEGGTVIAWKEVPNASPLSKETAEITRYIEEVSQDTHKKAFLIKDSIDAIIRLLEDNFSPDVKVEDGKREHLFVYHTRNEGKEIYWLVNDTEKERNTTLSFQVQGTPEKWDAESGEHSPLYCYYEKNRTVIPLQFEAWDAYYVVIDPQSTAEVPKILKTNLNMVQISSIKPDIIKIQGAVSPGESRATANIQYQGKEFTGSIPVTQPVQSEYLHSEGWQFSCKDPVRGVYARSILDSENQGINLGYHLKKYNDRFWNMEWLSGERLTVRDWWIIGPFTNDSHEGFIHVYPPERELKWNAEYEGKYGPVKWMRHTSDDFVVDLGKALHFEPHQWVMSYACTFAYSPEEREAEMILAMDNNARVWVNGEDILSVDVHPFYYRMRDAFAMRRPIHLKKGWNQILLKIGLGRGTASQIYGFMFKLVNEQGKLLSDVTYSPEKKLTSLSNENAIIDAGRRWYRVQVPPGTKGMEKPDADGSVEVFLNGKSLTIGADNVYHYSDLQGADNVMAIAVPANREIRNFIKFIPGTSEFALGSWTFTGLSYYVGSALYERTWNMPANLAGKHILLDLGRVGSAAEISVNGKKIGERVWLPFKFDITNAVHPGSNNLSLLITNTNAANEAMGKEVPSWGTGGVISGPRLLEYIDCNGLLGPVRIIPETEVTVECKVN